ncbi:peptidoglycan/LPS O-acetylase OafA/YrhL [Bradyrhizobium sp. USDA 4524]|uniref:acyltransferase family protein n=2 Tax=Bradyrhizobium TaxID=374 RepID=UPI00209D721E|nr:MULTISPECIES: acyltransferase [unclassified Bradyrhizobium]MCP1842625.1 peptidoglycan/LPS O-acetylase OafA/YrhL [Bradyrhizobium sp. USDA 4538]MCP1903189.1 peptidoglycan/LPS O-acetylase OafA/YrhL [Bradyrhizobium sp. USDA 4537]
MMLGHTIGSMLDRQKGFGPGFDFLRIALAISVVAAHAPYVAGGSGDGEQAWIAWFPHYAILVMFFALSGFLIAASGLRLSLKEFLTNRGMRIIPALAVEIVLSALILGPIFTALPLHDYFTNFGTYKYFTNIIGLVNYVLPGVFSGNPAPEVNSSLWTVPFEYGCYALMTVFILFGLLRKPPLIVLGALVLVGIGLALVLTGHGAQPSQLPAGVAGTLHDRIFSTAPFLGRGAKLPVAFMLGIAIYLYRDRIPYNGWLLAACCALCAGAALLGPADWMSQPVLNLLIAPALVYITAYLGVSKLPRLPLISRGDYSYGIYLYGFPVQQVVRVWLPHAPVIVQFAIALLLITLFAAFSWHWIEKPILKLRSRFSFVARERLAPDDAAAPRQDIAPLAVAASAVRSRQSS